MENLVPITWPGGGLVDTWSFSDQPANTAREYQNVRSIDPTNGRLRGAQRSGLTKYLSSALKAQGTKVSDLIGFTVDNRQVTYSALSTETVTWDESSPSGGAVQNLKADRQGNVYAIDGNAGLVKYSADGRLVWQLALPVADTQHVIRALAIDDFDNIYVGVSAGSMGSTATGNQDTARLWCYRQVVDQAPEQVWQLEPKAYTEDMLVRDGKLYTVQNNVDRRKSHVRIYDFVSTVAVALVKEWRIPHPANSIAVKKDGSVIVACEPSPDVGGGLHWREADPKFPEMAPDSVDWTPTQLPNSAKRIWSWYMGDSIDQSDCVSDIEDGVELARWRDSSRNNRHFYSIFDERTGNFPDGGPKLAMDGFLDHKGVRFDVTGTAGPLQAMKTGPNATTSKAFADSQRTMIPGYEGAQFGLYVVCRPSASTNALLGISNTIDSTQKWIFGQDRAGIVFLALGAHVLYANASSANGANSPPTLQAGSIFWYTSIEGMSGGNGTGLGSALTVRDGSFSTRQNASTENQGFLTITTQVWDGALSGDTQQSLFQVNGAPVDLFASGRSISSRPTYLGIYRYVPSGTLLPGGGVSPFLGNILEIFCLDRQSRSNEALNVFASWDSLQFDSPLTNQTINENTAIVGYLAHKYGGQKNLPFSNAAVNNYPHPFGITGTGQDRLSGPPRLNASGVIEVSAAQALANKRWGCVVKYTADGRIVWCANEQELISGNRSGGYGHAAAVNSAGNIYSIGRVPLGTGSDDDVQVRMIVDQGTDFSIQVADGAWSSTLTATGFSYSTHQRIDVDEFDNLYVPVRLGGVEGINIFQSNGTLLHDVSMVTGFAGSENASYAVAVDRRIPDYRNDITPKRAEHVFWGVGATATPSGGILKIRLVLSTQTSGATRSLISLGTSGGDIVKFTTASATVPTGGSGALDSTARFVQSATLFKKVYWTDGRQVKQYDPVTDAVTTLDCTSPGAVPSRCSLIETWRGRLVLARCADEPHNWFLSKKDDPTNWDYFPATPTEIDAVAGNNSTAGLLPDIVNGIVPYSEDILVFGGDHSIWMLVGDPAAGGRLELVSDVVGMAFGRAWCKDPNGVLYFLGSRGGLYRWVPGAAIERISLFKIERQLQDIDLTTYYVRLVWNYRDEGLHIFQCPFGAGGTQVAHWFWEQKTTSFAKDIFGTTTYTNVQPTAAFILDGDDFDDRVVLIGCEDGQVRRWDATARSDDTRTDLTTKIPIDSFATIFPIIPTGSVVPPGEFNAGLETQYHGLTVVLGDRESGCRYELFSSDEPDSIGIARRAGQLGPGRNAPKWEKVVGAYCGLRLRNAAPEERWAFERAYVYAMPAGMVRPRATN